MLDDFASTLLVSLALLGVISEPVQLAVIALIGGAITGMLGSVVTPLVLHLIKRQEDAAARRATREDAEAARKMLHDKIEENTRLTGEVKNEAAAAYKEANNVNTKLASMGIKTK